jgi:ribosomal protein L19
MKAKNYNQVLRARGYKARELSEYEGICIYEKSHKFNKIVCYVRKDSHGKGQEMTFNIYSTLKTPQDMVEFKEQEFDRGYLVKEAEAIHKAFEELKTLKAPKHLYCF